MEKPNEWRFVRSAENRDGMEDGCKDLGEYLRDRILSIPEISTVVPRIVPPRRIGLGGVG